MTDPNHPIVELMRRDRRFRPDAYRFVFEALRFGQDEMGLGQSDAEDDPDASEEVRHVTGQQLCEAIRRYALQQYGPLAKHVFHHWGVRSTGDFGDIVFNLIDVGQMRKTDSDRREDFEDVFDFEDGLRESFGASEHETQQDSGP